MDGMNTKACCQMPGPEQGQQQQIHFSNSDPGTGKMTELNVSKLCCYLGSQVQRNDVGFIHYAIYHSSLVIAFYFIGEPLCKCTVQQLRISLLLSILLTVQTDLTQLPVKLFYSVMISGEQWSAGSSSATEICLLLFNYIGLLFSSDMQKARQEMVRTCRLHKRH